MLSTLRRNLRAPAAVALLAFTTLTMVAPVASAGIVSTEAAFAGATLDADRARLNDALAREDVRAALVAYGVDPAVVQKRVSSLTADEVQRMNAQMDQMPAGGDVLGVLLTIFIILLITDLIGWTSVFPFTKKGAIAN
jgi:hypothetical protein